VTRLAAEGLRIVRAGIKLIAGLDLELSAGESLAVTGPSGTGKTSLLAVLSGLTSPDAGTVRYDDGPVDPATIGIVLQGYGLVSLLTAAENIEVALRARGRAAGDSRQAAGEHLRAVGLDEVAEHLIEELSGGQQQRAAVARALAGQPELLIADEPTAEQDEATRAVVMDLLFSVPDRGGALVLATHDPKVAQRCSRRIDLADLRQPVG